MYRSLEQCQIKNSAKEFRFEFISGDDEHFHFKKLNQKKDKKLNEDSLWHLKSEQQHI